MGAPPTFEVKGIFWQTFTAGPLATENPRCLVCASPLPPSTLTGMPFQSAPAHPQQPTSVSTTTPPFPQSVPADPPLYSQGRVHQPYAAAVLAPPNTQVSPPEPPAKVAPQVPRLELRPHSSVAVNVWAENLPPHPTDLRKRNDLRGHVAHGNFSRGSGSFAPPPTLAPAYGP